jgi:hypothetical protein
MKSNYLGFTGGFRHDVTPSDRQYQTPYKSLICKGFFVSGTQASPLYSPSRQVLFMGLRSSANGPLRVIFYAPTSDTFNPFTGNFLG